jgi:hypothetical protein
MIERISESLSGGLFRASLLALVISDVPADVP